MSTDHTDEPRAQRGRWTVPAGSVAKSPHEMTAEEFEQSPYNAYRDLYAQYSSTSGRRM
jgi:hypothetical protein